tara:strand:+ start:3692 stop:4141 length:450 start_codon:yes stop_codon:yes gene_type:complete
MSWKEILKMRISGKLRRYMGYANASQHNIRDRMSMETFAERVHSRLRQILSVYGVEKPIEKEVFDEINQMDENDPNMPFELPFSYEEYMEKYGNEIQSRGEEDAKFLDSHISRSEERRKRRAREMREKRTPEYYRQTLPQPLRTKGEEE